MDSSLLVNTLNEDNYDEYIEKIINVFRLSSKESSIIFSLRIIENKCLIKLSIVKQNGDREEFNDISLKCDEVFYNKFIEVLVDKFLKNIDVVAKDIVNLDEDSLVTLRLITENNDLFSIDGLEKDYASKLFNINNNLYDGIIENTNNAGVGNILIFALIIVIVVILITLFIYLF